MNRQFVKMDVWAIPDHNAEEGYVLDLVPGRHRYYMSEDCVMLGTTSVSFSSPENMSREEMAIKAIETLREKQKGIEADAHRRVMKLEERIRSLLMLTHQPDDNVVILREATTGNIIEVSEDDELPF